MTARRTTFWVLAAVLVPLTLVLAQTKGAKPLTEANITRLIELKQKDETIKAMVQQRGIDFNADEATLGRLAKAGASPAVLDALRAAGGAPGAKPATDPDAIVSYEQVRELVELGVPEEEVLARIRKSPLTFTPGRDQVAELKKLGASPRVLDALGALKAPAVSAEVTDLALVLDCSGSMDEMTAEGEKKMEPARRAAITLVEEAAEKGIHLAFVVYGHDRSRACDAVEVLRPLGPLDESGKAELIDRIGKLRPEGSTPIAAALRLAGRELAKGRGGSGVVLISDGKESCGGNPQAEAARLALDRRFRLGVQVVGFGVKSDEQMALNQIARAGKGKYYNAPTPRALRDVVPFLARFEPPAPAPPTPRPRPTAGGMSARVKLLVNQLGDKDSDVRATAAKSLAKLGAEARPAAPALADRVADEVWDEFKDGYTANGSKNAALLALRTLAPERVEEALMRASEAKDPRIKAWAAKHLTDDPDETKKP